MSSQAPEDARVIPLRPAQPHREGQRDRAEVREPLWRHLVGDVLRQERQAQGRRLKDVADDARISMPYLSEIERGRKEASSEVLAAAAHALGFGLGDLLTRVQEELDRISLIRLTRTAPAPAPSRPTGPTNGTVLSLLRAA